MTEQTDTIKHYYKNWTNGEENSVSAETQIEALTALLDASRGDPDTNELWHAAYSLRSEYWALGGDNDGVATKRFVAAYDAWEADHK